MEFIEDEKGKIYLMEINHLGWLLLYNEKDIDFLNQMYISLYDKLLNY